MHLRNPLTGGNPSRDLQGAIGHAASAPCHETGLLRLQLSRTCGQPCHCALTRKQASSNTSWSGSSLVARRPTPRPSSLRSRRAMWPTSHCTTTPCTIPPRPKQGHHKRPTCARPLRAQRKWCKHRHDIRTCMLCTLESYACWRALWQDLQGIRHTTAT